MRNSGKRRESNKSRTLRGKVRLRKYKSVALKVVWGTVTMQNILKMQTVTYLVFGKFVMFVLKILFCKIKHRNDITLYLC